MEFGQGTAGRQMPADPTASVGPGGHGPGAVRLAPPDPRRRRTDRTRWVGAGAAVLLVVAAVVVVHARTARPGGDPGGSVLRALTPVARAVPPGSGVVSDTDHDAVWTSACPDDPGGRAGWSGVEVDAVFTTTRPTTSVVRSVGAVLAAQGWRPAFTADDAAWQFTPVAEWSKAVPGATSARVVVFPYPADASPAPSPGGTTWLLGAEGKTPGYALPGC